MRRRRKKFIMPHRVPAPSAARRDKLTADRRRGMLGLVLAVCVGIAITTFLTISGVRKGEVLDSVLSALIGLFSLGLGAWIGYRWVVKD